MKKKKIEVNVSIGTRHIDASRENMILFFLDKGTQRADTKFWIAKISSFFLLTLQLKKREGKDNTYVYIESLEQLIK